MGYSVSSLPATRTGPPPADMPNLSRHSRTSRSRCMISASRRTYSASSISPVSSCIWRAIKSSLTGVSSVNSSRTTRSTLSRVHFEAQTGPRKGARRMLVSRPMSMRTASGCFLQLQLDVHEVIRWPRTGVLEGQQLFVLERDGLHLFVERLFVLAIDEKRGVEDHSVADDLVAATGDGDVLQLFVDVGDVSITRLFHGRYHQPAQLHARKVSRGCGIAGDLVLEAADLVILALDRRDDLVAIPEHLEPELDLVLHFVEYVGEGLVRRS